MSKKINWISILQGWSMLLVVIGHVTLTNKFNDPSTTISTTIETIIYRFHMPLFIFLSGFLFHRTSFNSNYSHIIKNKIRRLLVPYFAFSLFTLFLKIYLNPLMKRPVDNPISEILNILFFPPQNPLGEMWFVSTLFIIFILTPIFKISIQNLPYTIIAIIVFVILHFFFPSGINFLSMSLVSKYILYFYLGILFSYHQVNLYIYTINRFVVILFLFIISCLLPEIPIISSFIGIIFSISLCLIISRYAPRLFQSYRDYTYQIFLMGIFPQIGIRLLYCKINEPDIYWILYIFSIFVGIYIPVIVTSIITKIHNRPLRLLFGLS